MVLPEFLPRDPGRQQAIQLASELELDLLIEEEAGRQTAKNAEHGLHISGIAGQLLKATRYNTGPLDR